MVAESQSHVALLSVKPEYANAIFTGIKSVEFRKQCFKRDVKLVVIYSSSPEQRILGYIEIDFVHVATKRTIWNRYGKKGAITYSDYSKYYDGKAQAVAYGIKKAFRLIDPAPLYYVKKGLKAPQSYCYLDYSVITKMQKKTLAVAWICS